MYAIDGKIMVSNKREMTETIAYFRNLGWNLITLGERLSEMEKGDQIVQIEKMRRGKK